MEIIQQTKLCNRCGAEKPLSEFFKKPGYRCGYTGPCKPCRRLYAKRKDQRARFYKYLRNYRLLRKYGISVAELGRLIFLQGGRCLICRHEFTQERPGMACVDHDHATGIVRGILCFRCNVAIGHLRDSPDIARRAAAYLSEAH